MPIIDAPPEESMIAEAIKLKETPYVPKQQPENMKLCFKPFGFDTDASLVAKTLERYRRPLTTTDPEANQESIKRKVKSEEKDPSKKKKKKKAD